MRTAIFIVALSVHDVSVALGGKEFGSDGNSFFSVLLIVFVVMDIVDFFKKP